MFRCDIIMTYLSWLSTLNLGLLPVAQWLSSESFFFLIYYDYNFCHFLNNGRIMHRVFLWEEIRTLGRHINNCPAMTYPGYVMMQGVVLSRKAERMRPKTWWENSRDLLCSQQCYSMHLTDWSFIKMSWLRARWGGKKAGCGFCQFNTVCSWKVTYPHWASVFGFFSHWKN